MNILLTIIKYVLIIGLSLLVLGFIIFFKDIKSAYKIWEKEQIRQAGLDENGNYKCRYCNRFKDNEKHS